MSNGARSEAPQGPYVELSRADWAALARAGQFTLAPDALARLRGTGDPTSMQDVVDVYLPLCQLLDYYVQHARGLYRDTNDFLRLDVQRTPFVLGVAGSVAVGKSTTSRLLQALLASTPAQRRVDLVTTDGFLYPNAELERRGLLNRKGFPESYDRRALLRFVMDVKSGVPRVEAPVYSHLIYDIVPEQRVVVESPDILIVEGLNVLQPARPRADGTSGPTLADFFDFSVYVDAADADIRAWYVDRFMALRATAFRDPTSFFRPYAEMADADAKELALRIWDEINGPNLAHNIRPTRGRATAILRKGPDHAVQGVRIRKI